MNNKYKNIIHSQNLLLSNKDETISLLNERIEKLETQNELKELKQRIGELKKQNKELEKQKKQDCETLKAVSNELAWMVAIHEEQYSKVTNKQLHLLPVFIKTKKQDEAVRKLLLTMREFVGKTETRMLDLTEEEIEKLSK